MRYRGMTFRRLRIVYPPTPGEVFWRWLLPKLDWLWIRVESFVRRNNHRKGEFAQFYTVEHKGKVIPVRDNPHQAIDALLELKRQ